MDFLRHNLLTLVLVLCSAIIGGELWWLGTAKRGAQRALAALEQKKQERDWLARRIPAPSAATEEAIVAELAALRNRIGSLRSALRSPSPEPLAAPAPLRPMDAYFELAALRERARAQAMASGATLRPDECFGFASHANEGPAPDLLVPVYRQQQAVGLLLEPLFESRPRALLRVRRQSPSGAGAAGRAGGEDFFTMEPGLSVRRPGLIETEAVRLEFTGQTSTLRAFLGRLAHLRHPAVVRVVDVEPMPPAGSMRPPPIDAPVPVVQQTLSKYTVTVEFVLLNPRPAQPES